MSELFALYQNGLWLSVCIAKVIGFTQSLGLLNAKGAFEGLEPCDGKLSRTVLRGKGVEGPLIYPVIFNTIPWTLYIDKRYRRNLAFQNILKSENLF